MSEIVVIEKIELLNIIESTTQRAIDTYISKVESKTVEKFMSLNETMKTMGIGHKKLKQLLIDRKLKLHDNGKVLYSSVKEYLKAN